MKMTNANLAEILSGLAKDVAGNPMFSDEMLSVSSSVKTTYLGEDDRPLLAVIFLWGDPDEIESKLAALDEADEDEANDDGCDFLDDGDD